MDKEIDPFRVPVGTCYCVGGAVRDFMLGREMVDRDYVVVGAGPRQMTDAGFKPVGRDFPVFLHPQTKAEYALARTERKSGQGYHGFVFYCDPDVTLEQDLMRRDLTINAMAMDADGRLIDCHGGRDDLAAKVLRHVSPAFAEDPLRVLRVARFAAMLPDFTVAAETMALMRQMVEAEETRWLSRERIWHELARGLMGEKPSRMIAVMDECGLLQLLLPEVKALQGVPERLDYHPEGDSFIHTMMVLDYVAGRGYALAERFAALLHDIGKALTPPDILPSHYGHERRGIDLAKQVCRRLKLSRYIAELARLVTGDHGRFHQALEMRPIKVVDLMTRIDAYRQPARFEAILRVCEADFHYLPARAGQVYEQGEFLRRILKAAEQIDTRAIITDLRRRRVEPLGKHIGDEIRQARIESASQVRQAEQAEGSGRRKSGERLSADKMSSD